MQVEGGYAISRAEWNRQKARTELAHEKIDSVTHENIVRDKTLRSLDLSARRNNIIIDRLMEVKDEDIFARINGILDRSLSQADRAVVTVKKAYRLGKRPLNNTPRKVLVELGSSVERDLILAHSKAICKEGNNGNTYYVNEDVPEDLKKRRNDVFKYMKYMEKRKHVVEKAGDDLIIDGVRKKFSELNDMPVGDRLLDSRTVFWNGVVAFQSDLSPLSNLYPCQLRVNGMLFKSVEHAYQFERCIHHNCREKAEEIRREPDPLKVMQSCKLIEDNEEWTYKKVSIMENLLRHKADQCPMFIETLKRTTNHRLVENTWNPFWGSACNFVEPCVWTGQFKGANHLGQMLEYIRDCN